MARRRKKKIYHIPKGPQLLTKRQMVFNRDKCKCVYCGAFADTIDHIIPLSQGGTKDYDNIVACCYPCNQDKGFTDVNDFLELEEITSEGENILWLL